MHSQKLNDTNLVPWIILSENDAVVTIKSAHCNCMSGIGEACSHIAALAFYLEYDYRYVVWNCIVQTRSFMQPRNYLNFACDSYRYVVEKSVTDVFAYWVPQKKTVTPRKISAIVFDVPEKIGSMSSALVEKHHFVGAAPDAKKMDNLQNFMELLQTTNVFERSVSYSLFVEDEVEPEADEREYSMMMEMDDEIRPIVDVKNLKTLHEPKCEGLSLTEIINMGSNTDLTLTPSELVEIERQSVEQAASEYWRTSRVGRITASNVKSVCSAQNKVICLTALQKICYPKKLNTPAIRYGIQFEKVIDFFL